MSRIHQILSRAEREGTIEGLTLPDVELREANPLATMPLSWRPEADRGADPLAIAEAVHGVGSAPYAGRPVFGLKLNKLLVTAVEPFSQAAELYRSLRTRIAQLDADSPRQVLAITSPARGDGRTLTALNLALSMAQEFDRRTLIVDADLRHARLHTLLGIPREPGLVEVLSGATTISEALVTLPGHSLHVLPAGRVQAQPSELLGSTPMRLLVDALRRHFDRVVIDTAPAHSADTCALECCFDGTLVVVRAGRTTRPSIERALAAIPPAKLVGMVLNDSDSRAAQGLSDP